ncbi:ornithine cyclodeaminase family protein [Jatrophihabitans sp.]|uniref:ornithine cyclodeaminase family protein n=1 Tax=Jatrophihabitans sp. TaxID=1932789 RepID=UPI002BD9177B|nr:ornithine cyclodeaminase family protein [Jatrophihabitans sp.]
MQLPFLDADTLMALVPWQAAIGALEAALAAGAPTAGGPPRFAVAEEHGELLLMPAASAAGVGVKVTSVAPGNPARGLPRIQAVYVLFDAASLTPRLLIDGTALTTLRTPAQSALAVRSLARPEAASLVVFGAGPQAWGHVHAIATVRELGEVRIVGRDADRQAGLVERLRSQGYAAVAGTPADVAGADIVVCATTARQPVFDGRLLAEQACVVAVGSHEPDARELDDTVFARARRVVVEERSTALREAGDVIQAIAAGVLDPGHLVELAALPARPAQPGISVFKGVGMGWQDLAVAEAAHRAHAARPAPGNGGRSGPETPS